MDGFTGLNVDRARYDIENFYLRAEMAYKSCVECFIDFFHYLEEYWASPVAKEVTTPMHRQAGDFLLKFYDEKNSIVEKAVAAASTLAAANGVSVAFEPVGYGSGYGGKSILQDVFPCDESKGDGVVGMNVEAVNALLKTFESRALYASYDIEEVPEGIALYDPDGNLLRTYNSNIKKMREEFETLYESIVSKNSIPRIVNPICGICLSPFPRLYQENLTAFANNLRNNS